MTTHSQALATTGYGRFPSVTRLAVAWLAMVIAGLSMAAQVQTITLNALPAKTYGEPPFTVTATASSGLPITKWESSDPSVATVSSSGWVTLVGAGQTSIIASNTGDANYTAAWTAKPLNVSRSLTPLPFGTQTVTYNGSAQGLDPSALPSGQATEITYRDTSIAEPAPTPQVVFQNGPDTLALSYESKGFQAVGYWGMAKYARLAGTARKLASCDVTLVSWARYDTSSPQGYLSWADAHPDLVVPPTPGVSIPGNSGGYYHPVTLSFYDYANDGTTETYRLLTSQTVQAFIPWRPSKNVNGTSPYPNNGYAFRVPFTFPDGVILPQDVWVAVSFNTNTNGTAPIGATGPYDALNIPTTSGQQTGSDLFSDYCFSYKDWRWQASPAGELILGPMLRLRASPSTATRTAVNAATYEVRTKASAYGADPWSSSTLVINKAPLAINLTDLTQIRDGHPKPVTVNTTPGGIATSVTYAGSPTEPSALGTYPVTATSASPNYEGSANGTLQIGDSFTSWQTATFAGSGLPPEKTTDTADPDGDGLNNFLEYASNLNPLTGDNPSPVGFNHGGSTLSFTYRRNLHALDLDYAIQGTPNLTAPLSWALVTPLSETTVSDDGSTKVIQANVPAPVGQPSYFMRLKISR